MSPMLIVVRKHKFPMLTKLYQWYSIVCSKNIYPDDPEPEISLSVWESMISGNVQIFLKRRGCIESAHTTGLLLNSVAADYVSNLRESTLDSCHNH